MKSALILCAFLLASCGGGGSSEPPVPASVQSRWTEQPRIEGACCNYASIVITDNGTRIYTNTAPDGTMGALNLYEGGVSRTVLRISAPADAFIRTSAVIRDGGRYFALLETGDNYPGVNGYSPSWATSPDGIAWTWRGPVSPYPRTLSSGAALTRDESGFRAWLDIGGELREMRSADDGKTWAHYGVVPTKAVTFATAARTPTGTMLAVADTWPSNSITTLWQCGQGPWQALEEKSPIHHGDKGSALTYAGGLIHAYASGKHWTTESPAC